VTTTDFAEFYRSEYPNVYRAAFAFSGRREAALDATQEAFKRAFVRWSRLGREGWAGGWVMTTALNILKKESKRELPSVEHGADAASPIVSPAEPDRLDLITALRALPARQGQAALLFYLGDLPVPVVADLMNVAEGTVKALLAQARTSLRAAMRNPADHEGQPTTESVEGL
jgi:RNA polymerase sigma-70 factor (ECF subfamily)